MDAAVTDAFEASRPRLTRLAYRMLGEGGETVAAWDHIYILRRSDDRWRVTLTISDGEIAAWTERGALE